MVFKTINHQVPTVDNCSSDHFLMFCILIVFKMGMDIVSPAQRLLLHPMRRIVYKPSNGHTIFVPYKNTPVVLKFNKSINIYCGTAITLMAQP